MSDTKSKKWPKRIDPNKQYQKSPDFKINMTGRHGWYELHFVDNVRFAKPLRTQDYSPNKIYSSSPAGAVRDVILKNIEDNPDERKFIGVITGMHLYETAGNSWEFEVLRLIEQRGVLSAVGPDANGKMVKAGVIADIRDDEGFEKTMFFGHGHTLLEMVPHLFPEIKGKTRRDRVVKIVDAIKDKYPKTAKAFYDNWEKIAGVARAADSGHDGHNIFQRIVGRFLRREAIRA